MKLPDENKFQYILNIRGVETDVLQNAPDGWLDTNITYKRSATYIGLFRGLSVPIKFVLNGARLLRKEFYTSGILANVKVKINQWNPFTWTYNPMYSGQVDFSKSADELTSFTANSISNDFTTQLNANDGVDYSIPVDVDEAINLELTALNLKENAILLINQSSGSTLNSNCFRDITVGNNQQNSVNNSVQNIPFVADATPDFPNSPYWFFRSLGGGNVVITGNLSAYTIGNDHLQYNVYKQDGTVVKTLFEISGGGPFDTNIVNTTWNFTVTLNKNEKLFFYIKNFSTGSTNTGTHILNGQFNLNYTTITPASMCKAVPAMYVFRQLLQAMNTNTDSGPNQPVPCKSALLTGLLKDVYLTCSDSIRSATGSLFVAGDTLYQGLYKVVAGSLVYNGTIYNLNDQFSYSTDSLSFSGGGTAQKISSFLFGFVYNPGDSLQPGATYLVGGNTGTFITYNSIAYSPGQTFLYVLGQETFTGSDDSSFVEQISVQPQLITNFKDFFQFVYGIQGGNAAFGIDSSDGMCFIETLDFVYRGSIGNLNCGIVDKAIKIEPAIDLLGNSIRIGYKDQQYNALNAYSEVNSEQVYSTSILTPQKEINLICPYRADPEGIEEIRVTQTDTAASRSDNDIFIIWKEQAPVSTVPFVYYHPLGMDALTQFGGVDKSYYNWKLTPKQNMLRGGNYLSSIYYGMKGYKITLSAAPKNTALYTVDTLGNRVAESDPVYISSLPAPLFIPMYVTIKPGLPTNALQMLDSIPYGFARFTYNDTEYKGFMQSVSVDIGQHTTQELKFLLTTNNDLSTFIH